MKHLFALLLILSTSPLWGQGSVVTGTPVVSNPLGQPIPGATVAVCTTDPGSPTVGGCPGHLASLYTDITIGTACTGTGQPLSNPGGAGSGCSNPGTVDGAGNVVAFSAQGQYWCEYYGGGITGVKVIPCIFPATPAGNAVTGGNNVFTGSNSFTGSLSQTGTTQLAHSSPLNQQQLVSAYFDYARPTCVNGSEVSVTGFFIAHSEDTPTYVNTPGASTPCYNVALMTNAIRSGTRGDSIWGFNPVVQYSTAGNAHAIEVDVANNYQNFVLGGGDTNIYQGLSIISGGLYNPDAAFSIFTTPASGGWLRGIVIGQQSGGPMVRAIEFDNAPTYALYGASNETNYAAGTWSWVNDASTHPLHRFQPFADDTNTELYGTNAANSLVTWSIDNKGNSIWNSSKAATYSTNTNCSSSASPAVCGAAAAGSAVIAAAATTVVVNTSAVTANSQILITRDNSLGTKLTVTCNTQSSLVLGAPYVSARSAGVSFTLTIDAAPTTNPMCFSYSVVN